MKHPNERFTFKMYDLENRITRKSIRLLFYHKISPTANSDDYRCVHCWDPVPEDDVPLLIWSDSKEDMAILHFDCANGLGLFSALGR